MAHSPKFDWQTVNMSHIDVIVVGSYTRPGKIGAIIDIIEQPLAIISWTWREVFKTYKEAHPFIYKSFIIYYMECTSRLEYLLFFPQKSVL